LVESEKTKLLDLQNTISQAYLALLRLPIIYRIKVQAELVACRDALVILLKSDPETIQDTYEIRAMELGTLDNPN